jgi:hypothetical protein
MTSIGAIFFALMLLVAPCKVRNSIEVALGIEKTEVSNKIKSVVPPICCATQAKVVCTADSHTAKKHRLAPVALVNNTNRAIDFNEVIDLENPKGISELQLPGITVPYYILHSNFKVYS